MSAILEVCACYYFSALKCYRLWSNWLWCILFSWLHKNPKWILTLLLSGISISSVKIPGSNTGPQMKNVRWRNTVLPVKTWRNCNTHTGLLDAMNKANNLLHCSTFALLSCQKMKCCAIEVNAKSIWSTMLGKI